jgi:hypothetical protein
MNIGKPIHAVCVPGGIGLHEVRPLLFPRCVPLIVACLVCFVLRLNEIGRLILPLPVAAVS